jgi:hypothetical protein
MDLGRSKPELESENALLYQQPVVLKHPALTGPNRALFVLLSSKLCT